MYKDIWNNNYQSVCSLTFTNARGEIISTGTGFKIKNKLVTNNHVFACPNASYVEISFVLQDGFTIYASKKISYTSFIERLLDAMPESSWDFAILELNDEEFDEIPSLKLAKDPAILIGEEIAVLGFPYNQKNLSQKKGIISSRFKKSGVDYIQLDASINPGNSGGPLIRVNDQSVIGIVTRKMTGLSDAFDMLTASFDRNIEALSSVKGSFLMSNVDPFQSLMVSQEQLKIASKEIKRSANVGIGFAYELDKINDFFQ